MAAVGTNQSAQNFGLTNELGYVFFAWGNTAPADGTKGYAGGCMFIDQDNSTWYWNAGDHDSANFDQVTLP